MISELGKGASLMGFRSKFSLQYSSFPIACRTHSVAPMAALPASLNSPAYLASKPRLAVESFVVADLRLAGMGNLGNQANLGRRGGTITGSPPKISEKLSDSTRTAFE
jgi:hypothetical protein